MLAHAHRTLTGCGQHVDVSCQDAVARALANAPQSYALDGAIIKRQGSYRQTGSDNYMRITWQCRDGFVNFLFSGGAGAGASATTSCGGWLTRTWATPTWRPWISPNGVYGTITMEMMERMVPVVERFMSSHTKQELFDGAVSRRILLFPVAMPRTFFENPQLAARDYFRQVPHAAFDEPLTLPGPFARVSGCPLDLRYPPPRGRPSTIKPSTWMNLACSRRTWCGCGKLTPFDAGRGKGVLPLLCLGEGRDEGEEDMRPLEGLKVLDFCWVAVGPMTTGYLAEYGATVVRAESRLRPEVLRSAPPFGGNVRGPNRSAYYANYNANKFGFGLNMAHPQGVDIVKRLVAWADLVTENFTPGTLEKWGLGYDELRGIKPDIILFSTSMLGRGGAALESAGLRSGAVVAQRHDRPHRLA